MPAYAITRRNFKKEVKRCKTPVLLCFCACGVSSAVLRQTADVLSEKLKGRIKVGIIAESRRLTKKYNVSLLPSTLLLKDGVVSDRIVGNPSTENFLRIIDNV